MTDAMRWALALVFPVVLAGCPSGSINVEDARGNFYYPDSGMDSLVLQHDSHSSFLADSGQADHSSLPADSGFIQKDSYVPPDSHPLQHDQGSGSGGVGEPCPCQSNLFCYNGTCVSRCTEPTDPCQSSSACAANERCVELSVILVYICLPTTLQIGDECGNGTFCPNNSVCGAYSTPNNPGTLRCVPLCTQVGSSCGSSGGQCVGTTDGCLFCTLP